MNTHFHIPVETHCKNLIHALWQVDGSNRFKRETIIPKGVVEVIFNFSEVDLISSRLGSNQYHLSKCFINGFNTVPIHTLLPQQQSFFGIVLQPLAVKQLLKTPAGEFADHTVDLTLIDPAFNTVWHQLAEQTYFNKRVEIMLGWLKTKFVEMKPQEQFINHFLYNNNAAGISVNELAKHVCYSPRQLSRKLLEATGMNSEALLLYKKFTHSVELIHQSKYSLTEVAYQCNFSDQSHFIKTFKAFTNLTPGEYKKNMSYVKGHLYENVR